ncbi:DUF2807 domain-containing protein [Mucilaginibacter corticis]|uniref:DUF2807 domain-containing protein n=1 Tax=Mucilaginibacter corticis TaxID=2597670 RepID=A0A556MW34_9SPHI|nr:head GIN domain-containing protein [Mucilaginibacter corticis]TSJ44082.1 DUF2807 domain-containing protein [Mucilaginibacter corticis]
MRTIKNLIVLAIMLVPAFCIAQETQTRKVDPFNQVRVGGSFNVFINYGNEEQVKIEPKEGDPAKILTEVKDGILKVRTADNERNIRAIIYITYKKLESIEKSGSGDLTCQSDLAADNFRLSNGGSGNIVADKPIKAKRLNVSCSGSGNMKLADIEAKDFDLSLAGSSNVAIASGQVQNSSISVAGSGNIRAFGVKSDKCALSISGSSRLEISAAQSLEVAASGSSEVLYKGNAQLAKISTSGSTQIKKVD